MQRGVQGKVSDDVCVWQELFGRRSEPKIEQVATTLGRAAGAIKSRLTHLLGDHAAARRLSRVLDMREHGEAACNKHQPVAGTLNEGQYAAFLAALRGQSIFLTGGAGTGKSYTLKEIIRNMSADATTCFHEVNGIAVLGTTGIAADHINGKTIHSFGGIFPGVDRPPGEKAKKRYRKVRALVIDEVSMLDESLLDRVDRDTRLALDPDKPMGGLQVIFVGDFCQLPPIGGRFAFQSEVWKQLGIVTFELTEVIRQVQAPPCPRA